MKPRPNVIHLAVSGAVGINRRPLSDRLADQVPPGYRVTSRGYRTRFVNGGAVETAWAVCERIKEPPLPPPKGRLARLRAWLRSLPLGGWLGG